MLDDFYAIVDNTATQARTHANTCEACRAAVIFDFLVFYVSNFRFVVMMTKLYF